MRKTIAFTLFAPLVMAATPQAAPKATVRPAPKPAPQPADWTTRVTTSPIGGHIMGNPAAKTRVIEYISYSCVHCAALVNEGGEPLKQGWVRGGTVNIEVRNLVRDIFDLTTALLARCGGAAKFFGNHTALFANYDAWWVRLRDYDAIAPSMTGKSREEVMAAIADTTGLFDLMEKRGFQRPQLVACLNDKTAIAKVLAMTDEATEKVMVGGTPGIVINGQLTNIGTWDGLKAALPPGAS